MWAQTNFGVTLTIIFYLFFFQSPIYAAEAPKAAKSPHALQAPKIAKSPNIAQAPNAAKSPRVAQAPNTAKSQAPKTPNASQASKTAKAPRVAQASKTSNVAQAPNTAKAPKVAHPSKTSNATQAPSTKKAQVPKAPKAIQAPKVAKAPDLAQAAKTPNTAKAHKIAQAPKAPNAAKTPKVAQAPKAPNTVKTPKVVPNAKAPKGGQAAKAPHAAPASKTAKAPKVAQVPKVAKAPKTAQTPKAAQAPKALKEERYKLAIDFCSKRRTGDARKFCLKILKSNPKSASAKDYSTLLNIATNAALENAKKIIDSFDKKLNIKTTEPALKSVLKDCIDMYRVATNEYSAINKKLKSSFVGSDASVANNEIRGCQALLVSRKVSEPLISNRNRIAEDHGLLVEHIAYLV